MITIIIAMAMVYCTTAGNLYGRGPYGRVMLHQGHPKMEGANPGLEDWTQDKVSS
jgi:hypothetical protein